MNEYIAFFEKVGKRTIFAESMKGAEARALFIAEIHKDKKISLKLADSRS